MVEVLDNAPDTDSPGNELLEEELVSHSKAHERHSQLCKGRHGSDEDVGG